MPDLPKRKTVRLKNYDYSSPGAYFITVCTHNKEKLLSEIKFVGEGLCALPPTDDYITPAYNYKEEVINFLSTPHIVLTDIGEVVKNSIEHINEKYQSICVVKYVIMPNHIHILLSVNDGENTGGHGDPPLRIYDVIGRMKSYTTKVYGKKLWQRSFHDRIIRSDNENQEIYHYIEYNAWKWKTDCFYCE